MRISRRKIRRTVKPSTVEVDKSQSGLWTNLVQATQRTWRERERTSTDLWKVRAGLVCPVSSSNIQRSPSNWHAMSAALARSLGTGTGLFACWVLAVEGGRRYQSWLGSQS